MKLVQRNFNRYPQAALMVVAVIVMGYFVLHAKAAPLVGDLNNDGTVNVFDLSILLSDWGTTTAAADLNNDGTVNIFDLSALLSNWGQNQPTPTPTPTPSLLNQNYDALPVSDPVSVATERLALGDPTLSLGSSNLARTSIVAVSGRGNVMRITIPPNTISEASGVIIDAALSQSVDEASIQYDIRFDSNFDWSRGGKLPGLGGAVAGTAPSVAGGCNAGVSGAWSGRSMWITPSSYPSVTGTNEWIGYMYNYNKVATCGDNQRTAAAFTPGTWHTIKQYYKLNTVNGTTPVADGVHKMWLDGTLVNDTENFLYRDNTNLHINYLYWELFRGGGDSTWASPTQGTIDIDNLLITSP